MAASTTVEKETLDFYLNSRARGQKQFEQRKAASTLELRKRAAEHKAEQALADSHGIQMIPIKEIIADPKQPRQRANNREDEIFRQEVKALAADIQEHGLQSPIAVRPAKSSFRNDKFADRHMIIWGEKRWNACIEAGMTEIPAYVLDISDKEVFARQMAENEQRSDFTLRQRAMGYKRMRDEFGLSLVEIASRVGKHKAEISRVLNVYEDKYLADHVDAGRMTFDEASRLVQLPIEARKELGREIVRARTQERPMPRWELRAKLEAAMIESGKKKPKEPSLMAAALVQSALADAPRMPATKGLETSELFASPSAKSSTESNPRSGMVPDELLCGTAGKELDEGKDLSYLTTASRGAATGAGNLRRHLEKLVGQGALDEVLREQVMSDLEEAILELREAVGLLG